MCGPKAVVHAALTVLSLFLFALLVSRAPEILLAYMVLTVLGIVLSAVLCAYEHETGFLY